MVPCAVQRLTYVAMSERADEWLAICIAIMANAAPTAMSAFEHALIALGDATDGAVEHPEPVHLVLLPLALVAVSTHPYTHAATLTLAVGCQKLLHTSHGAFLHGQVLAVVVATSRVLKAPPPAELSAQECAHVAITVGKHERAGTVELVVLELAEVVVPTRQGVLSLAVHLPVHILPVVPDTIRS